MNESQFARRIAGHLGRQPDPGETAAERLRTGRQRALDRQQVLATQPVVAWGLLARLGGPGLAGKALLPVALLAGALLGYHEWQQSQALLQVDPQAAELADIDVRVLKGELPIDAYIDRGFAQWLADSRRSE